MDARCVGLPGVTIPFRFNGTRSFEIVNPLFFSDMRACFCRYPFLSFPMGSSPLVEILVVCVAPGVISVARSGSLRLPRICGALFLPFLLLCGTPFFLFFSFYRLFHSLCRKFLVRAHFSDLGTPLLRAARSAGIFLYWRIFFFFTRLFRAPENGVMKG